MRHPQKVITFLIPIYIFLASVQVILVTYSCLFLCAFKRYVEYLYKQIFLEDTCTTSISLYKKKKLHPQNSIVITRTSLGMAASRNV